MKNFDFQKYEALLFDLDGTLADTMELHNRAWIQTLNSFGCEITIERLAEYAGVPNTKSIEAWNQRFGWNLDPVLTANQKESLVLQEIHHVRPIPTTLALVQTYFGRKPMAIVSGGDRKLVETILNHLGLRDFFATVVTSESTARAKPHPDPFLRAAKNLRIDPAACLVFEDGQPGIDGARSCGMSVIQVLSDHSLRPLAMN